MPRLPSMTISLLLGGALAAAVRAQDARAPITLQELPCTFCHTCDNPTAGAPCLRACPRTSAAAIAEDMLRKRGPNVVILNELEDLYLPVPFDHRGHAHMALMTDRCEVCHHHAPEGSVQPACKNCHGVAPEQENIRKPNLKVAYHRQCMSCHREWSGETKCAACHPPKSGKGQKVPTVEELLKEMPAPIPEPRIEMIYEPESKPEVGPKIVFRHKEHINFGLECASCHHEDSCSRCHAIGAGQERPSGIPAEGHRACAGCHDVENKDACDHCHWREGERKPKPFDHARRTGWPLSRHHAEVGCRGCHQALPFRKLDRDCNLCHGDWKPDTFDHAVTGQVLDENHEEANCVDCHADRKFDSPPKCDECHEEDEGIAFPAQRPGPLAIPSQRENTRSTGD
jgi:hypothetical protein